MQDFLTPLFEQFKQTTYPEWLATITGLTCIYLAAKENIWNWPIGIINVCCFAYIFIQNKIYGDALLQAYFLSTCIYGWYYWNKRAHTDEKPIVSLKPKGWLLTILAVLLLGSIFGLLLDKYTDSDVAYPDGFCVATSLVAQFLMTRKILENWLLWVFVDICYIPLFFYKGLLLTTILFIIYTFLAWNGYRSWKRTYDKFA